MKVVGLITEYNPFHNGHKYHIDEAKRITGADYVVVVMSGNYVQRGAPALIDKYSRTKMALACGADLVFELPVCYATASAEFFALGAVSLLDKLGIIDDLCFGSECGDINILTSLANILLDEQAEFSDKLCASIKQGKTYPEARMEALKAYAPHIDDSIIASPNNILGIEYIKALIKIKSNINPVTITRKLASYHSEDLSKSENITISSATAIRKSLKEDIPLSKLEHHVPEPVISLLKEQFNQSFPVYEDDFSLLLNYKLMEETEVSLTDYTDVTKDLANRIKNYSRPLSYSQFAGEVKSRQWTLTRVNRVLIHILLNLKYANLQQYNSSGYTKYARLLGFKKESSYLLRQVTTGEKIPVITKMGDAHKYLDTHGMDMLNEDIFASHLYNQVIYYKFGTLLKDEYTRGVIMD